MRTVRPRSDSAIDDTMDSTTTDAGENEDDERMTTKRRRMQQLIQRSMDMTPRTFEHEAPMLPVAATQQQQCIESAHDTTCAAHPHAVEHADANTRQRGSKRSRSHTDNTPGHSKYSSWTPQEDAKLRTLVRELGTTQWSVIATHFVGRDRKRCRERYVNHLDPSLTTTARLWTPHDDEQLVALQRERGNRWAAIARTMRGRSADDVKNRFSALAARDSIAVGDTTTAGEIAGRTAPRHWSRTETDALRALVATHGPSNWFFIASQLPGRTDLQCMQQWQQVLDPAIVKGKGAWTPADDAMLAERVHELGPKWTQIARFLPGRMGKQCRERYLNHVDPAITKLPWTADEDAALEAACRRFATQWTRIAAMVPGRTENAVKNRWRALVRQRLDHHPPPSASVSD